MRGEVSCQASIYGELGTINNQRAAAGLSPRPHRYRDNKGGKISTSLVSPDLFLYWDFETEDLRCIPTF